MACQTSTPINIGSTSTSKSSPVTINSASPGLSLTRLLCELEVLGEQVRIESNTPVNKVMR